jgi:hypothetical protein
MSRALSPPDAPPGCSATIEQLEDGMALHFPPLGWRAAGIFPLIWAGFWNLLTIPFAIGFYILAAAQGVANFCDPPTQWWLLFPLPFLLIGFSSVWLIHRLGRRGAVIVVDSEKLRIASIGVFKSRQEEWNRTEVVEVRAGPSSIEVNDEPVLELQFRFKDDPQFGLLAGRGDPDLKWAASVLRQALVLESPPSPGSRARR